MDSPVSQALLDQVQRDSFRFFPAHLNPGNGLVRDSSEEHTPCSIAAVGFALSSYPVAVFNGWMSRAEALSHTLTTLRFFDKLEQSEHKDAGGWHGFYYHFIDMDDGRRAWKSELSTIDTALLLAGMLTAAQYFDGDSTEEREVRSTAAALCERADWRWAQNGGAAISLGWTPERGFLPYRWIGYSEALILYALALGSKKFGVSTEAYAQWLSGYRWRRYYGQEYVYAGPLFIHQFSHIWIDFRNIQDEYMREHHSNYFENSRRATHVHREYAKRNPRHFRDYHGESWGLTASNGPGPCEREVHGRKRKFWGYRARGAPHGPDDGTVSPWAAIASLPFAPEIVLPTIRQFDEHALDFNQRGGFGFFTSFNPSFHEQPGDAGWVGKLHLAINQGPIVLMLENYQTDMIWNLMRNCAPIVRGLQRAGFSGGWLRGM